MRTIRVTAMIFTVFILTTACAEDFETLPSVPGCLLQNAWFGFSYFSLSTGITRKLIPYEIQGEHILRTPALAMTTSTIYYVDQTGGLIMSYRIGDSHSKRLYDLPTGDVVEGVQWLLLSPSEETLFFLVEQEGIEDISTTLIAYNLHTDQSKAIRLSRALATSQHPAWVDSSTLLVLTLDATIETLDIHSGELMPVIDHAGYFAFSASKKLLLVNTVSPKAYLPLSTKFVLYEFPSLKRLDLLSLDMFQDYEIGTRFCFTDDHHVFFSVWVDAMMGFGTVWLDLRSFEYSKITSPGFETYLPLCPSWGFDVPSHADENLAQQVQERLHRSASHIPMLDFVSIAPEGKGVIRVFGTLQSEEDIATVLGLIKHVSGVNQVISHIEVGNHQWMYEQKIEHYLKWGYESCAFYDMGRKQRIYQQLSEYLFYRDHLEPPLIKNVEEFRDLLKKDIETGNEGTNIK